VDGLAQRIVRLRTLVEATLDFPEEEIDFLQQADAAGQLSGISSALDALLATARQGALLREGLRVVIAGQPNVGKSSLLNALAGAELAIVTPIPGTTRDRVSESIQIEGVPVHVTDTAGLRRDEQAADEVERIGIGRSWDAIRSADCVLFLHDLTRAGQDPVYDAAERDIEAILPSGVNVIQVWNKADAAGVSSSTERLTLSARTGQGLEALRQALLRTAGWQAAPDGVFIARARHVQALQRCAQHLSLAHAQLSEATSALDLLAEELRLAHLALGEITGAFSADDLLGEIFGKFCIGK
jgi:tRNA modification GTPase